MAVHIDPSLRLPTTDYFPGPERQPRIVPGRSIGLIAAAGAGIVLGVAIHEWPRP
jgi:hypothetical protein